MAQTFLTPIDLSGLELLNALAQKLATAPTSVEGKFYYDTTLKALRYYNGTAWVSLTASTNLFADPNTDQIVFWDDSAGTWAGLSVSGMTITGTTLSVNAATTGAAGVVALADSATTTTGSDATKAVTPAGLKAVADTKAALSHTHVAANITDFATAVDARVQNIVGAAPAALDTLAELATALGNDANYAATTATALAARATKFSANVGDGTSTAIVVTHNLNTRDVEVDVYRNTTPWDTVIVDVERTSVNTITLRFATAPAASAFRVAVQG